MRIERRTLIAGFAFGLAGTILALPVAGIVPILPFALIAFDVSVTSETGEPRSLLRFIMIGSALYLPSALLLGILAGWFHRVTNSNLRTALLGFGSLSLVAIVQPFFFPANYTAEGQSLVYHQSIALGMGLIFQILAAGIIYARGKLPIGAYQVVAGVISGVAGSIFAGVVLDYIFIYGSVVQPFLPILLTLGVHAGLLNRITKSKFLTTLLGFVSVWIGMLAFAFDITKYVSAVETIGIDADVFAGTGQGLLFQWIAVGVLYAVRMIRGSVWKR